MKKLFVTALFIGGIQLCFAQASRPPAGVPSYGTTPMSSMPNEELFKDRSKIYFYDEFYIIDGKKVIGTPFLYHNWMPGVITTADERVFSGYKVKYNAFHQTVYFHNGTDSLEVDDQIKHFTLMVKNGDSTITFTFINASQIRKEKKPMYYELLLDHPTYQLLKYNRKFVSEAGKTLPVAEGRKIFDLEVSYFLFNKTSRKIMRLKASGTNIVEALGIEQDQVPGLKLENYDFSAETDLLRFFRNYFSQHTN